jgi:hypothetical protein
MNRKHYGERGRGITDGKRCQLEIKGSGWRRAYLRRRRRDGEKASGRSCDGGVRAATLAKQKHSRVRQPKGNETRRGRRTDGGDRGGVRPYLRSRRCGEERERRCGEERERRRLGGSATTLATYPKRCEEAN